jgi:hypothetical protein
VAIELPPFFPVASKRKGTKHRDIRIYKNVLSVLANATEYTSVLFSHLGKLIPPYIQHPLMRAL